VKIMSRKWLRKRREGMDINQEEMADLCFISRPYYNQLENGSRGNRMSLELLSRIAYTCEEDIEVVSMEEIKYQFRKNKRRKKKVDLDS
jgi:transcriptional regulator with XRE-family HTH domain